MQRKILLKKTVLLGISTLASRVLGFLRQLLLARFLGVGAIADAFWAALRLPNSLYKIFVEGSLGAALIPTAVKLNLEAGPLQVNRVMSLMLLMVQLFFLVFAFVTTVYASQIMLFIIPGWSNMPQLVDQAANFLSIFVFYIFFFSASSFLAGVLQAQKRFFLASAQPIIFNILLVLELLLCLKYNSSPMVLAWMFVVNSIFVLGITVWVYSRFASFSFIFDKETWGRLWELIKRLIPCFINLGIVEINLFIGTMFASFLPEGSISLLSYSSSFLRLPLSLFSAAFATVSLPYFTQIGSYAPRRLGFQLVESAKLTLFIMAPVALVMAFFSYDIFLTTLVSDRFSYIQAYEGAQILMAFVPGLFFFSLNRILLNIYYAQQQTTLPTFISLLGAICNTSLNLLLMYWLSTSGIALATSIAAAIQVIVSLWLLHKRLNMPLYVRQFLRFAFQYMVQLSIFIPIFYCLYRGAIAIIPLITGPFAQFFMVKIGLWLWVGPLCLLLMACLWLTRKLFGLKCYYLD
ncbi:MAG TPA: murein biosynthesis integral membrane protein MurJ [Candidatus Babeliaceae bacterium]|nr:murein biosynthesis integral membrane protein MurJ [Candidatus Babeliaceae bacterium]